MKFIRKEHIVTTIFDKELKDDDVIRGVFVNLYTYAVDFSIIIKKYTSYQDEYSNITFDKVRVLKVNNDSTVDILVFKNNIKMTMNNVHFSDVVQVVATTRKHNIVDTSDDALSRWEILDLK